MRTNRQSQLWVCVTVESGSPATANRIMDTFIEQVAQIHVPYVTSIADDGRVYGNREDRDELDTIDDF